MGLKETLKDYGEKVKENPTLLLIPAGAIGGLYLLFRPAEMMEPPLSRASVGQPIGGGGENGGMSAGTDSTLSQIMATVEGQSSEFSKAFNDLANQFASFQTNTNYQLAQVNTTQQTLSNQTAFEDSLLKSLPNIYFDGKDDAEQYFTLTQNVKKEINSGNITADLSQRIMSTVAGLGNDGVGWNPTEWKSTQARLDNDTAFRQSEVDRAKTVIQNRLAEGLSIDNQVKYLNSLTK